MKGFVSVEINSTIAKLTVWHNWLNKLTCTPPPAMELLHAVFTQKLLLKETED